MWRLRSSGLSHSRCWVGCDGRWMVREPEAVGLFPWQGQTLSEALPSWVNAFWHSCWCQEKGGEGCVQAAECTPSKVQVQIIQSVVAFTFIKITLVILGRQRFCFRLLYSEWFDFRHGWKTNTWQWICWFLQTQCGSFHWTGLWKMLSKHDPVIRTVDRGRTEGFCAGVLLYIFLHSSTS